MVYYNILIIPKQQTNYDFILQISEQVDDVSVTFDEDLCVECVKTDAKLKWNFQIKTEVSNVFYVAK